MSYFALGGDGPNFVLSLKEAEETNKKGFLNFRNKNLHARISILDHDPNLRVLPNEACEQIDGQCNPGLRLRRYPEKICPHDFKGNQFYLLRVQKNIFESLINQSKIANDRTGYIHPRCKYDRFALIIQNLD